MSATIRDIPITRNIDGFEFVLKSIYIEQIKHFESKIESKDEQIKILTEALEFYGKHTNWLGVPHGYKPEGIVWSSILHDDLEFLKVGNGEVGGKRARQTLKQIKEKKGER